MILVTKKLKSFVTHKGTADGVVFHITLKPHGVNTIYERQLATWSLQEVITKLPKIAEAVESNKTVWFHDIGAIAVYPSTDNPPRWTQRGEVLNASGWRNAISEPFVSELFYRLMEAVAAEG